jgi:hypothetical protein
MAAFFWGDGGAQLTPEAIAAQRKIAQAMMARGGDYSPVQSWTQGLARVAEGFSGGLDAARADVAERQNAAAEKELLASLIPGAPTNIVPPGASAAPSVAPSAAITSAPLPTIETPASDNGLTEAITKVAAARGVDPAYLGRLAKVESGGNVNATTPLSSAKGPFQFIDATAKQYGLNNPTDATASADAAARFTLDNKAALTRTLGREPTPGELYLAHQQGASGASKILTADPNTPIEQVIGYKAAANNGAVPGMTAGQFAKKWTSRFSDIGAQPGPTATATADPAALPPTAQSAEGYAIPGQPAPAVQTVAQAMPAASGVNPRIMAAMASPYVSEGTKRVLGIMIQQQAAQNKTDTVDLGNEIGVMRNGQIISRIPKGEPNKGPEFGVIGKDAFGNEQYGWRDPRDKSTTPVAAPQGSAQPTITGPDGKPIPIPAGVDPKVIREAASKATAAASLPATFEDTAKLRHEVTQLPSYKNLSQAAPIYQSMAEAAGRNTKAADLNLVYGLGKIMDPGSVVREGEIQMANNAQGWQEKLNGIIAQINGQGGLTPEGRQALMAEAYGRIGAYKAEFDRDAGRYKGITERNRMNVADVIPDFGTFSPWTAPKSGAPVVIDGYTIKAK